MSGTGSVSAVIPAPSTPLTADDGTITPVWRSWLLVLQRRTGGTAGKSVDEEAARLQAVDDAITTNLAAEAAARTAADSAIQAGLGAEATARTGADATLTTAIANEASARAAADAGLLPRPAGGVTWTAGNGAPTATQPRGSLWSRLDGAVGTTLYVSQGGGAWNPVAGV